MPSITLYDQAHPARRVTVALGVGRIEYTDVAGGWSEIDRKRRDTVTEWGGRPQPQMKVPVLFADSNGISDELARLRSLAVPGTGMTQPPVVRLTGPLAAYPGALTAAWVINGIEWAGDPEPVVDDQGRILRQAFVLTLLQYQAGDLVLTRVSRPSNSQKRAASRKASSAKPRWYTTRSGDTLSRIASRELGDWRRFREIRTLNPSIRNPDKIPTGTRVRLPS